MQEHDAFVPFLGVADVRAVGPAMMNFSIIDLDLFLLFGEVVENDSRLRGRISSSSSSSKLL